MIINPIKTPIVVPGDNLLEVVLKNVTDIPDKSVLILSSKIVSICERNIAEIESNSKDELVKKYSQYYLDRNSSKYCYMFTITKNSLVSSAGIDESNANGHYVIWPKDPLTTARYLYENILKQYGLVNFGIQIVDSTSKPFRLGTTGLSLAHWGFEELNNYIGKKDIFNRPITVSRASIAEGLASAGVLVMGEGNEQTPLALASELDFVNFNSKLGGSCYNNLPSSYADDVYEPFWNAVDWQKGKNNY